MATGVGRPSQTPAAEQAPGEHDVDGQPRHPLAGERVEDQARAAPPEQEGEERPARREAAAVAAAEPGTGPAVAEAAARRRGPRRRRAAAGGATRADGESAQASGRSS